MLQQCPGQSVAWGSALPLGECVPPAPRNESQQLVLQQWCSVFGHRNSTAAPTRSQHDIYCVSAVPKNTLGRTRGCEVGVGPGGSSEHSGALRSPRPPSTTACSLPCPSALSPRIPEEGRPQSHSSVCSPPPLGLSLSPAAPEQSEGPWASPHPRPHPPSPGAVSCRMGHTARLTWPAARREPCASRRRAQARAQRRRKERLGESSSSVKI